MAFYLVGNHVLENYYTMYLIKGIHNGDLKKKKFYTHGYLIDICRVNLNQSRSKISKYGKSYFRLESLDPSWNSQ